MSNLRRGWTATMLALILALGLVLELGQAARAETAGERLFFEGAFSAVTAGDTLVYGHRRDGSKLNETSPGIEDGEIQITLRESAEGAREAQVALLADGKRRQLNAMPASTGNPLLLLFLESSLRAMAGITGGSPFYIRNRMKEALRSGGEIEHVEATVDGQSVDAEQIVFRPFAEDKNRDRMGEFADLELRFLLSEKAPGGFILFSASTPGADGAAPAFREEIAFMKTRENG